MFCPKCRTKYLEGISVCGNCGVHLVQQLPLQVARTILLVIGSFIFYIIMGSLFYRKEAIAGLRFAVDICGTIILILISVLFIGVRKEFGILRTALFSLFNGFFSSGCLLGCMMLFLVLEGLFGWPSKHGDIWSLKGLLLLLTVLFLYFFIFRYAVFVIFQKSFSQFSAIGLTMLIILFIGSFLYVIIKVLYTLLPM